MRGAFLVLVTILGFASTVYAETGLGIDCDFDTNSSYIEQALRNWAGPKAGGIEVRSIDEGKAVLQRVINSGDINQILVSRTAITLANPKVIFTIRDEKTGSEYPFRACALIQGDIINRVPVTINKQ